MKTDNETREVVREMRQKVDEAKSSLTSNRSRGRVLDALMQQKKSGRIPGIFGRLVKRNKCLVSSYCVLQTFVLNVSSGGCLIIYLCACRETWEP